MTKVALFGGTFDPPHNGHIHMMLLLQEMFLFDGIYIVPTSKNPFKETKTPAQKRYEMCNEAFKPFPWCKVIDFEAIREGVSYTIDTIDALSENDPFFKKSEKFFLLGQDAASSLGKWKEVERLLSLAQPIVISRDEFTNELAEKLPATIRAALQRGWKKGEPLGLSSTEIRGRLAKKLYIEHLVPASVFAYIQKNHLYVKE